MALLDGPGTGSGGVAGESGGAGAERLVAGHRAQGVGAAAGQGGAAGVSALVVDTRLNVYSIKSREVGKGPSI